MNKALTMSLTPGGGARLRLPVLAALLLALLVSLAPRTATAQKPGRDYLKSGELTGILASSLVTEALGELIKASTRNQTPRWTKPLPLESKLMSIIGGDCKSDKFNFLDNSIGSVATPLGAFTILTAANFTWPQDRPGKDAAEDAYVFTSGVVATKGLTGIAKGFFSRQRPNHCPGRDSTYRRENPNGPYYNQSFFSGHTSSAFYSSVFLNNRLRSIMRQRMSGSAYRNWRWAPPTLLFGWATFVGWSRVHAHKHYPSDVVVGAAVGALLGELFYSFVDNPSTANGRAAPTPPMLQITITF